MQIFLALLSKLIPLYFLIGLGYLSGKFLHAKKETLAVLLIYIITPVIIFHGVLTIHISLSSLSLPILLFLISCSTCLLFFKISKFIWNDTTKNILAFTAGAGNTGYFGLPVALILFPTESIGLYILGVLRIVLYENSLGFYITAKGHHTAKESLLKVLKLPSVYTFFLGLLLSMANINVTLRITDFVNNFRGAYTVLGMMVIGLGLADITKYKFDFKFVGITFLAKFLVWPTLILSIIFLDRTIFQFYNVQIYNILVLLSSVPLAANTVVVAAVLKTHPEKAALAVLLSTLFALFFIPFMVITFIQ